MKFLKETKEEILLKEREKSENWMSKNFAVEMSSKLFSLLDTTKFCFGWTKINISKLNLSGKKSFNAEKWWKVTFLLWKVFPLRPCPLIPLGSPCCIFIIMYAIKAIASSLVMSVYLLLVWCMNQSIIHLSCISLILIS